jgi:hypothetical protein
MAAVNTEISCPGTYAGLIEKIPYLRELGVNCVELMPVFEYDELDNPRSDPATGRRLSNYGDIAHSALRPEDRLRGHRPARTAGRRVQEHGQEAAPGRPRGGA